MKPIKGSILRRASVAFALVLVLVIIVEPANSEQDHSHGDVNGQAAQQSTSWRIADQHRLRHRRHPHHSDQASARNRNPRAASVTVNAKVGQIEGTVFDVNGKKVHAYFGVPFAEPPVGDLRFKAPVPIKPWSGVYRADKPAKSCFQASDQEYKTFRGSDMWNAKTEKTEDCLYMNIWVPAGVENATTMVWLYGGGFWYGSASLDIYNGLALAAEGKVIVVTPNYRMGVFGFLFLDHPEVPGNVGLLDQQTALRWIQENIAAFNGDPRRVNLFGESAGAASIVAHMVAEDSWPLFHNGILQSGTLDNPWSMDTPSKASSKSRMVVQAVQCDLPRMTDTVQCLRNKTAAELDSAMWDKVPLGYLEFPLVIVSKDHAGFFRQDAYESLRQGRYRPKTDLMFGINQDEGAFWMVYYDMKRYFDPFVDSGGGDEKLVNISRFNECINDIILLKQPQVYKNAALWEYGGKGESCKRSVDDETFYRNQLNQMIGDYFFTCDSIWLADDVVRLGTGHVYVYHFEQRISTNPWPKWMGVMHGYEIEYIFGLPLLNQYHYQSFVNGSSNGVSNQGIYDYSPEDRAFTKDVIQYWASFASNGIPKSRGQNALKGDWPEYKLDDKAWYVLRATSGGQVLHRQKQSECKMWRSIRDIEYQLYEAQYLSSANGTSFHFRTLVTITTISFLLSIAAKCV